MQQDSARFAPTRNKRRRRSLVMEALETRLALSATGAINPLAVVQGYASEAPGKIQAAQIHVSRLDFSTPNRPTLLRFDMGAGSPA